MKKIQPNSLEILNSSPQTGRDGGDERDERGGRRRRRRWREDDWRRGCEGEHRFLIVWSLNKALFEAFPEEAEAVATGDDTKDAFTIGFASLGL